jgi:hypothetical protein
MSKVPDQNPRRDQAIPGGVTNEIKPDQNAKESVRRRDDLTIRGTDPKEVETPRQMSDEADRKIK